MTALSNVPKVDGPNPLAKVIESKALDDLDAIVLSANMAALSESAAGPFKKALSIASVIDMLRQRLDDSMMRFIMPLQNSALGFLTDRPRDGYPMDVVRDVTIEATLRGAFMTGNEVNIISGRCYLTKEFFARAVRQFPGLSDLNLTLSVPRITDLGAEVGCVARWKLNGAGHSLERTFPVKVNSGMGGDAILGKATRKLLAAVYGRLIGSEHTIPDGEIDDVGAARPVSAAAEVNRRLSEVANGATAGDGPGRDVRLPSGPSPASSAGATAAQEAPFTGGKSIGDAKAEPPASTKTKRGHDRASDPELDDVFAQGTKETGK